MANSGTGFIALFGLLLLTVLSRFALFFFLPQKFQQVGLLDWILLLSLIILLASMFINEKSVVALIKEYKNFTEIFTASILGIVVGLLLALLSVGPDSFLGSFVASVTDSEYVTLTQLGSIAPDNKLDQLRLSIAEQNFSPRKHFFMNLNLNYYIALAEEMFMAGIIILLLAFVNRKLVVGKPLELYDPASQAVLPARGGIFSVLHIFAFTGALTYFTLGYFIPAFVAGIVFGILFYWRGLLPVIMAHTVFNQAVVIYISTGLFGGFTTTIIGVIIVLMIIYYFTNKRKF